MKLISWNVNGIRACYKKGLMDFIKTENPDIFCVQETKAHIEQVEAEAKNLGYPYFYWSSAIRKGYSGVATFSKIEPREVKQGIGISEYDSEGRIVHTSFPDFELFNIYFPNGGSGDVRHDFKQKFLRDLKEKMSLLLQTGRQVILVGDYNIAHKEIDVFDPVRLSKESGFLPEERQWLDEFFKLGMIDCFRLKYPDERDKYTWWSYRELARVNNRGWRIDYICVSNGLGKKVKTAQILDQVEGSDHCPVLIEMET